MVTVYRPAAEVAEVAGPLIRLHHQHLLTAPIAYVFRTPPAKSGDRLMWAKVRKVSGLNAYFARMPEPLEAGGLFDEAEAGPRPFHVMEVAEIVWDRLTSGQRTALVDHELCHLAGTGDDIRIVGHTVEEFTEVVARHGAWTVPLWDFVDAGRSAQTVPDIFDPASLDGEE